MVLLKLQAQPGPARVRQLADGLGFDLAGTHRAVNRLQAAGLYVPGPRGVPLIAAEEFLISAVKYFFPAVRGRETRGVPTSWAATPLKEHLEPETGLPPVWPDPDGPAWGLALDPLHPIAPVATERDERLRQRLALLDAIRDRPTSQMRSTATKLMRAELRS